MDAGRKRETLMKHIEFQDKNGSFIIHDPENYSGLYLPMAGEKGLKSSITPNLGGDSKTDQNHFLLEPVSIENLHNNRNTRNFWCQVYKSTEACDTALSGADPKLLGCWSVCGNSAEQEFQKFTDKQDESTLEAGFMWQKISRKSQKYGLQAEVTSFVTISGDMEVEYVEITNISEKKVEIVPTGAIPVYGRSADNLRDHRHVTSLLHRIRTTDYGVEVTPVLSFDERGHQKNNTTYFVYGSDENGEKPESFYPTVEEFIGEGGTFLNPEAVRINKPGKPSGTELQGKEAVGGIRFSRKTLKPRETAGYILLCGIADAGEQQFPRKENTDKKAIDPAKASKWIESLTSGCRTRSQVRNMLEEVKEHWIRKVNVAFETGSEDADNYLKWICFQPILRRIYGCSFLPYHDYGKGGRGWRDLWQDCLALLIMEPSEVRQMIIDNYGGVRIDGTNATIIGSGQGEFIADRNNITRVWMDHSFWPFVTTKLYLDQTGDLDVLFEKIPYFKDLQSKRGTAHDEEWNSSYGNLQKTDANEIYHGTVLEHILLQNLCAFFDVGDHNEMCLHGADWNDALDMAWEKGESVAFTCAYAGNLKDIAYVLREIESVQGINRIELAEEMECLFACGKQLYENPEKKQKVLKQYTDLSAHNLSGNKVVLSLKMVCSNLEEKADWFVENIRKNEWIQDGDKGWFNGYYDNHGRKVEYSAVSDETDNKAGAECNTRMMLTGQVFAVMSATATEEQIQAICRSADAYLYDRKAGGYRLNTDFKEEKFDLGRMFGFAYGEKENGAVFSHMAVMYANALYKTGHAKEGYKVLQTLLDTAMDFERSKMYPGIPEYFDNQGRGLYAYLTGAASWYMLTMITEVFGVKGQLGDMVIAPALMPEQYDQEGKASLKIEFAGRKFSIHIFNREKKEWNKVQIKEAFCDGTLLSAEGGRQARLKRSEIEKLTLEKVHEINIILN